MDPYLLHIECSRMVKKTQSVISEVERKMRNLSSKSQNDNVSVHEDSHPLWLRCLIWFCHTIFAFICFSNK